MAPALALAEVETLTTRFRSITRLAAVPCYNRPEATARIVRLLNEYYVALSDIEEWEQEIPALAQSIRNYIRILRGLHADTTGRMTADYSALRVQSSPPTEPHLRTITQCGREYQELAAVLHELEDRHRALTEEVAAKRAKWLPVTNLIQALSPTQRAALEGRHRWGRHLWEIAVDLHYEATTLSHEYCRALWRLAGRLG